VNDDGCCWSMLQRSRTIRSIDLWQNNMGSKTCRLLLEGVKVRSGELCLLGLLILEPLVCFFVCVGQQLNNSLEELDLADNRLTDEFTADDNFTHLGKLKKLNLSSESFSVKGIAAISRMLQVQSSLIL